MSFPNTAHSLIIWSWYNANMRTYIAPEILPTVERKERSVFLGGGISNCPDWQKEVIRDLQESNWTGTAISPRRSQMFSLQGEIANEQIEWEHAALSFSPTIAFWFPCETMCPITLFELGVYSQQLDKRLIVGTHPDYARRFDVIKQLSLSRPEIVVTDNLESVVSEIKKL